jgi:hypothetical protein
MKIINTIRVNNGRNPKGDIFWSKEGVKELFNIFYNKVKHGDEEHMKWLKDETDNFIEEYVNQEKTYE